ncbi:MAG: glycosyltransferase family 2 protein [Deltaproteobacteria bacterium]|nr:glycosyltransferase family 2 protein [Deltaproteobacteria bacterium]MBW2041340.1 glycosyltransferase family 2 protein [Deltaproteobacteria bacterium]
MLIRKVVVSIQSDGLKQTFLKSVYYLKQNRDMLFDATQEGDYAFWRKSRVPSGKSIRSRMEAFETAPKFSILMPVFNTEPKWLERAVESVFRQVYPHWELCITDDASTRKETVRYLDSLSHARIQIKRLERNLGIAGASNAAAAMAAGEYVAFLDHDDEITEDALFEMAAAVNETGADLIYSDEDKIDPGGVHRNPFFKPDWSPDLLRCQNYICHFTAVRKRLFEKIGGFRSGYEGAQDHDLFLRIAEHTTRIHHIPKVLYGWREIASSTAGNPASKPMAQESGRRAVDGHVHRVFGPTARVFPCNHLYVFDVFHEVKESTRISIIIPTKDRIDYLGPCVRSILKRSTHPDYEILILDNNSEEPDTRKWFERITREHPHVFVVPAPYPFCWSKLNNHGMEKATGDVFIFLNNDTEVISPDWMQRLGGQALREDVGAVGPLLLYKDGTIQHAGVVVGLGGWADHLYQGVHPVHLGTPFVSPMVKRNVLAVTGSCMAVSRKTIERIGPFNEAFMICGSDVELCIRAHEKGLFNIYDPFVRLYHFESKTRNPIAIPPCDFEMSEKCYKAYRLKGGDPFYNANLSLKSNVPRLSETP